MSRSPRPLVRARLRRVLASSLAAALLAGGIVLAAPLGASAEVPNRAQVVVKTGGERDATTRAVQPLRGVVLELRKASGNSLVATCTSDADGDCVFTIPNGSLDGTASKNDFWVVQAGSFQADSPAAEDYFRNPEFVVSTSGSSFSTTPYRIAVDDLKQGTTRTIGSGGSGTATSSGIWQSSHANPPAQAQCGLDIALVSDLSYSVALSNSLGSLKTAATGFVDALAGTPSTISLYTFGTNAPAPGTASLLDRSTLDANHLTELRATIGGYAIDSNSYTNWDASLRQLFGKGYDQVVVLTDGNPTRSGVPGTGSSGSTRLVELEQAVFSANTLKADGTRVVAVGVGSSDNFKTGQNLRAISGETAGSDYFISGWSQLADKLDELARANCEGTVTVVKKVVPWNESGIAGAQPASGWQFTAPVVGTGTVTPSTAQTTKHNPGQGDHGTINYKLTEIPSGASFQISEQQQSGYTLVREGGKNAVCTKNGSTPVTVTNVDPLGFSVPVGKSDIVTCTVYNKEPTPIASVEVDKLWIVNGQEYSDGAQPEALSAQLELDGTDQAWGEERGGLTAGGTIAIAEEFGDDIPALCEVVSQELTKPGDDGVSVDISDAAYTTPALAPGLTSYLVTNTVECGSELVLIKDVTNSHGGTATPANWKLGYAGGPAGGVASGTVNSVIPGSYAIEEIGKAGSQGYAPREEDPVVCVGGELTGATVAVPIATRVTCTFYNEDIAPRLQLKKTVVGADLDPEEWTLTASKGGAVVVSGDGFAASTPVKAGVGYTLAESTEHAGGGEFTGEWVCTVTGGPGAGTPLVLGGTTAAPTVTLALGQDVECVVTNTLQPSNPRILKTAGTPVPNADGSWDVPFTVTVTNPSAVLGLDYYLVDTPALPAGVTGVSASYRVGGGSAVPVAWTGGPIQLTPSAATIPAGAGPVVYTVTLTLAVSADVVEQPDACGDGKTGVAIDNLASLTPVGSDDPLTSDDCAVIELPEVDYEKAVTSLRQLAGGDWEIVYEVGVTATGPGVARYDLRDVPEFGDGIAIRSADATATPAGQAVVADWNGGLGATPATLLAEDRPITATGSHRYEITIVAAVAAGVIGTEAADCALDEQSEDGTGFLNRVWLAAGGPEREPREACASPAAPEFEKSLVDSVKNDDGTVTLVYELVASNPSEVQLSYDLDDTIGFAVGVGILDAEVTDAPAGVTLEAPAWDGVASTRVATGVLLPPGAEGEHVYEITILAEPTLFVEEGDLACVPGTPGKGYFNGAVLTSGEDEYPDDACAPIPATDLPTLPLPPDDLELETLGLTGTSMAGGLAAALALLVGGLLALRFRGRRPAGRHAA